MSIELQVSKLSWMRFLPQIYQVSSDENNAFLQNLLWIFQQIHDSVRTQIDDVHTLFRPADAPAEFLPWLAGWIALQLEDDWPDEKKRRWMRAAPALYHIRGTRKALELLLEIYIGVRPRILENEWPQGAFRVEVSSVIGESSTILPPMNLTNCFVVELPLEAKSVSDEQIIRIHRVIQAEKPAHTTYFLRFEAQEEVDDWGPFMTIGDDQVGAAHRRKAVGDDDGGAPGHQGVERVAPPRSGFAGPTGAVKTKLTPPLCAHRLRTLSASSRPTSSMSRACWKRAHVVVASAQSAAPRRRRSMQRRWRT